jgi:hypothetical protein
MKLLKKSTKPTGRQRLRPEPVAKQNVGYNSRRSDSEPNTGRQQLRRARLGLNYYLQRLGLIVLLLAVAAALANAVTLSAYPKVLPLGDDSSPFLRPLGDYETAAAKLLSQSVWNRNKITVNAGSINRRLTAQFPELAGSTITLPLLAHRPLIYIQPAKPVLILNARNGAFIIADTGKALLRADNAGGLAKYNLPPVTDQSGLALQVGRQALPSGNMKFIQTVKAELAARGVSITSMSLPPNTAELDVQPAGQGYSVKFNLQNGTARQQAGTYLAAADYLKKHNTAPAKYVDVRVDGRAYYQ